MSLRQVYFNRDVQQALQEDPYLYCPHCGEQLAEHDLYGQSRRLCHQCDFIHYRNPAPTVSLLIVKEDRILLGRRLFNPGKGKWATPSGYVEIEEDYITTAVREAKEETGLDIEIAGILNVTASFLPPKFHFFNVYLRVNVVGGELRAGDDMEYLAWFPFDGPLPDLAFQEDLDLIEFLRSQTDFVGIPVNPQNQLT